MQAAKVALGPPDPDDPNFELLDADCTLADLLPHSAISKSACPNAVKIPRQIDTLGMLADGQCLNVGPNHCLWMLDIEHTGYDELTRLDSRAEKLQGMAQTRHRAKTSHQMAVGAVARRSGVPGVEFDWDAVDAAADGDIDSPPAASPSPSAATLQSLSAVTLPSPPQHSTLSYLLALARQQLVQVSMHLRKRRPPRPPTTASRPRAAPTPSTVHLPPLLSSLIVLFVHSGDGYAEPMAKHQRDDDPGLTLLPPSVSVATRSLSRAVASP